MWKFISCLKPWKFKLSATAAFPFSIPRVRSLSLPTVISICALENSLTWCFSWLCTCKQTSFPWPCILQVRVQPCNHSQRTSLLCSCCRHPVGRTVVDSDHGKHLWSVHTPNVLFFISVQLISLQYLRSDLPLSRKTQNLPPIFQKKKKTLKKGIQIHFQIKYVGIHSSSLSSVKQLSLLFPLPYLSFLTSNYSWGFKTQTSLPLCLSIKELYLKNIIGPN